MAEVSSNWSLLLAEDNNGDAELVRLPFRKAPVEPEFCVVQTVQEAIATVRERRFDIVICDLRLRDGSGLDIVKHIRDTDLNVPILMLTGYGSEHEAVEAIRNGANDYFVKNRDTYVQLPKITSALVNRARSDRVRQLTTAELRLMTERFRDYAEAASDWFWETGPDHRLTFVSGVDSDGLKPTDFLGHSILDIAADPSFSREQHEQDIVERRRFRDFIYTSVDARTVRLSGKPYFSPNGDFLGYRGVGTDITDQIRTEESLRVAKIEAEKANLAKSRFLAVMSHELRTPLNAIIGFSESLLAGIAGSTSEKANEYLTDIKVAGRHLLNVVNDVLDLSKIEAGHYDLSIEPLEPDEVIAEAVQFLSGFAAQEAVRVTAVRTDGPLVLWGDRRAVRQILINVISNAVKFTPDGGEVEISAEPGGDGVTIAVRDSGVGIPADKLEEVLKPFHQVDNLLTRRHEGTGLGLPIAKGLVESHNGSLVIDSAVGSGTTVWLNFPARDGHH